jgi:hypothetical protein
MNRRKLAILLLAFAAPLAPFEQVSRATPVDGGSDAGPPPPRFDAEPVPTERSKAPTRDEWRAATPVSISRNLTPCRAYRVREWMKINCNHFPTPGMAQLAGPRDGVQLVTPAIKGQDYAIATEARPSEIVFPMRQGTGHVFQIFTYEYIPTAGTYTGDILKVLVMDQWIAGQAPLVTIS